MKTQHHWLVSYRTEVLLGGQREQLWNPKSPIRGLLEEVLEATDPDGG